MAEDDTRAQARQRFVSGVLINDQPDSNGILAIYDHSMLFIYLSAPWKADDGQWTTNAHRFGIETRECLAETVIVALGMPYFAVPVALLPTLATAFEDLIIADQARFDQEEASFQQDMAAIDDIMMRSANGHYEDSDDDNSTNANGHVRGVTNTQRGSPAA